MGPPAGTVAPEKELRWAASPPPPSHDRHRFHRHHHPVPPLARQQRKGTATRAWLVVPESGTPRMEELGRHSVMRRAGIPARDLRILDPALSYPSTVLGRERAIVVNLENVKVIITATEVLVPNSKDSLVAPFVRELQLRVSGVEGSPPREPGTGDAHSEVTDRPVDHSSRGEGGSPSPFMVSPNYFPILRTRDGQLIPERTKAGPPPKVLPFEFRALEVCLECACCCLESETSTLEQEAYPTVDELTSKVSILNLQRVRQIKNRLVLLFGRVHKVRDELENLLDDDMDMAEMHLTEKFVQRQLEGASSMDELDDDDDDNDGDEGDIQEVDVQRGIYFKNKVRGNNENLHSLPNIQGLEMLLEAYFVRADGTLNKLSALKDYVDDTEDYINIMLGDKQNQLLQVNVVLVAATMTLSAGIAVVGLLGMNIHIGIFDSVPSKFWGAAIGTFASCVLLFVTGVAWGKRNGYPVVTRPRVR